jgi:hypothetical protein
MEVVAGRGRGLSYPRRLPETHQPPSTHHNLPGQRYLVFHQASIFDQYRPSSILCMEPSLTIAPIGLQLSVQCQPRYRNVRTSNILNGTNAAEVLDLHSDLINKDDLPKARACWLLASIRLVQKRWSTCGGSFVEYVRAQLHTAPGRTPTNVSAWRCFPCEVLTWYRRRSERV